MGPSWVPVGVLFLYLEEGQYLAVAKDGTLSTLRRLELTETCTSDHSCEFYAKGTRQVAGRLLGRPDQDFVAWHFQPGDDVEHTVDAEDEDQADQKASSEICGHGCRFSEI